MASIFIRKSARHIANKISLTLSSVDDGKTLSLPEINPEDGNRILERYFSSLNEAESGQQPMAQAQPDESESVPNSKTEEHKDEDIDGEADENDGELDVHLHLEEVKSFLISSEALIRMKREFRKWLKIEAEEEKSGSTSGSASGGDVSGKSDIDVADAVSNLEDGKPFKLEASRFRCEPIELASSHMSLFDRARIRLEDWTRERIDWSPLPPPNRSSLYAVGRLSWEVSFSTSLRVSVS